MTRVKHRVPLGNKQIGEGRPQSAIEQHMNNGGENIKHHQTITQANIRRAPPINSTC